MPEAMKIIRAELGNDAVILNSKIVHTGGFLGLFKKKSIEVIAAVDEKKKRLEKPVLKEKPKKVSPDLILQALEPNQKEAKPVIVQEKSSTELLKEISELKSLMQNMAQTTGKPNNEMNYPGPLQALNHLLHDQEIEPKIVQELMTGLLEKWYVSGANASETAVKDWLKDAMTKRIENVPYGGISFTKKYINVVGPTGVGKTTTLAKIAADCVLKHQKKVAFITTDTYRIAAIEQLKTYAQILNVPIEVCYSIADFQKAAERFAHFDMVLIDTAGRNFRNKVYVEELQKVIDFDNEIETFLVLAATSKQRDMEDIYKQFSLIHIDKLIFTKIDETSIFGAMINMIEKYNIGVAYLTNGQNVPDDMISAQPNVITNTVLGVE